MIEIKTVQCEHDGGCPARGEVTVHDLGHGARIKPLAGWGCAIWKPGTLLPPGRPLTDEHARFFCPDHREEARLAGMSQIAGGAAGDFAILDEGA